MKPKKLFEDIIDDVYRVYNKNKKFKKDMWRTIPFKYLNNKLIEEYNEYFSAYKNNIHKSYNEILDVINIGLMIASRLKNER